MSRIVWDATGERLYETGVKNCVLYVQENGVYNKGVPWNGITSIDESPSGAEATPLYADDIKYLNLQSAEEFGASVEAYTYPDEFAECDGSSVIAPGVTIGQQSRKPFGLCYKTTVGNDTDGNDHGYKLHLIYGALAAPSEKAYATINDSPEAISFSWEISTTPVNVSGFKPTASLIVDSTQTSASALSALEDVLYGTASTNPRLPFPDEVAALMDDSSNNYAVSLYLVNVENTNTDDIASNTYTGTISAIDGYTIENVIIVMGGVDITDTAYTSETGVISITNVTGPITIYATANEN